MTPRTVLDQQVAVIMYGPSFVETAPEVARRWMVAYVRGLRAYDDAFVRQDPAAYHEAVEVLAANTVLWEDRAFGAIARKNKRGHSGVTLFVLLGRASPSLQRSGQLRARPGGIPISRGTGRAGAAACPLNVRSRLRDASG